MKKGDRWQVTHRYDDGAVAVRRLGRGDIPRGKALVLPAGYVSEDLELGYASTVHRAQGSTVDTAHALIDPEKAARELLYVALTRGRLSNHAYVVHPDPHEVEPHLDQPETDQLARVLARSDADLSATETLTLEADRHASLSTLLDEYDVLAREAQVDRWATFLDVAPFPEGVADDVFTSPYYERLEGALARHEAAGHAPTVALNALAPRLASGDEQPDPASQLATMLDQATSGLPPGKNTPVRVAGLLATPAEPVAEDMRAALTDRQVLIEAAARRLAQEAQDTGAAWIGRLGQPGPQSKARAQWKTHAATIALYRYRHDITGRSPLGDKKIITTAEQASEHRAATVALRRAQAIGRRTDAGPRRHASRIDPGHRL